MYIIYNTYVSCKASLFAFIRLILFDDYLLCEAQRSQLKMLQVCCGTAVGCQPTAVIQQHDTAPLKHFSSVGWQPTAVIQHDIAHLKHLRLVGGNLQQFDSTLEAF